MKNLEAQLQPIVASITQQLIAGIVPVVVGAMRESLLGAFTELDSAPPPVAVEPPRKLKRSKQPRAKAKQAQKRSAVAERDVKPANMPKPVPPAGVTVHGNPRQRAVPRCGKCGALGFRADGCGTSHQPANGREATTKPAASKAMQRDGEDEEREVVEADAEIVRKRRGRRRDEAFDPEDVIPHRSLVLRLAADRANNFVGDAGSYVPAVNPDAPLLVGPTKNTREVCPVHGWVGAFRFDQDSHDTCVLPVVSGEPCTYCHGQGRMGQCNRCGGTGIVPQQDEAEPAFVEDGERHYGDKVTATNHHPSVVDGQRFRPRREEPRARTIPMKKILRRDLEAEAAELARLEALDPVHVERPKTRGECIDMPRPCAFVGCRHHLYLDVDPETGSIKLNFPHLEPEEVSWSCALDEAANGEHTLEALGERLNVTRERTRQLELIASQRLREGLAAVGVEGESAA